MVSHSQIYRQNSHSAKIQDGGGRHIQNYIFGHNSAIIARICTEFETWVEDEVPHPQSDLPAKLT